VFYQDVTLRGIEDGLKYYSKLEISVAWTIQLYKALEKVPTLQNTIMNRYLLMMWLLPDRTAAGTELCQQQHSAGGAAEKRRNSPRPA